MGYTDWGVKMLVNIIVCVELPNGVYVSLYMPRETTFQPTTELTVSIGEEKFRINEVYWDVELNEFTCELAGSIKIDAVEDIDRYLLMQWMPLFESDGYEIDSAEEFRRFVFQEQGEEDTVVRMANKYFVVNSLELHCLIVTGAQFEIQRSPYS